MCFGVIIRGAQCDECGRTHSHGLNEPNLCPRCFEQREMRNVLLLSVNDFIERIEQMHYTYIDKHVKVWNHKPSIPFGQIVFWGGMAIAGIWGLC